MGPKARHGLGKTGIGVTRYGGRSTKGVRWDSPGWGVMEVLDPSGDS